MGTEAVATRRQKSQRHQPTLMSLTTELNIAGLVLNAAGVILLFFFAMPYRTRSEGKSFVTVVIPEVAEKELEQEGRYDHFAWLGLAAVLIGTSLQIWAAFLG